MDQSVLARTRVAGRLPYVIAGVRELQLAVSAAYVQEILRVPVWHPVPRAPRHIRGVINLRGRVLPLTDLRVRLNLPSALEDVEEMIAMLSAREHDHARWLRELQGAVTEGRPFTLARDPFECAFGKWYYNYKPEDIGFASAIYRLELPHRRIHAIADAVLEQADRGHHDQARKLIREVEDTELRTLVQLFEEARIAFRQSHKEVAVVVTDGRKHVALTVDRVASVEPIAEDSIQEVASTPGGLKLDLIQKLAHRTHGKGIVFLLEAGQLLDQGRAA